MAYTRPVRYVEGETMFACDICGFPYRFPSEMVRADDNLFYCTRTCWLGKTPTQDRREQAERAIARKEEAPPVVGRKPSWW